MHTFIDIETIPAVHLTQAERYDLAYRAVPGTHKKPDSIRAWILENKEDQFLKTSFDYKYGWIACVSVAKKNGDVSSFAEIVPGKETYSQLLEAEKSTLQGLEEWLGCSGKMTSRTIFTGWNVSGFDLPWLFHASLRAGCWGLARAICPPGLTKYKLPWLDLMEVWSCFQYGKNSRQTDVAKYLGVHEPHPEIDGSMVYGQWKSGKKDYITHCESDVVTMREIALKLGSIL